MKLCLACGERFSGDSWRCPACGYTPEMRSGRWVFAPEMGRKSNGFDPDYFMNLDRIEESHWWFLSRKKLVIWALGRHFFAFKSFFEIGCGTGFMLSGIQKAFAGLTLSGSDLFVEGLAYAGKRLPKVSLFQMDACRIPFREEFDVIGAFDVLEHIDDDREMLREMFRAVKTGGGIILSVPQHPWLWSFFDEISCHRRRYTRGELVEKVKDAGFRPIWVTSFFFLLFPLMAVSRLRRNRTTAEKNLGLLAEFRLSPWLNRMLEKICDIEGSLIQRGYSFQVGGSLFCIGVK